MIFRIPLNVLVALAVSVNLLAVPSAEAIDTFWDGGGGTNVWGTTTNWNPDFVPLAQFSERAVIGTDNPSSSLDASVLISVNQAAVGGIALGYRERVNGNGALVNPTAPVAGTLMGTLTITGGQTDVRTTAQAAFGADGRTLVGFDGRGYLVMTGGILKTTRLTVAGENLATGPGRSRVELSGNASLLVENTQNNTPQNVNSAVENTATLSRDLKITGPNVTFTTFGRLTLSPTNAYHAEITSPTTHSVLRTTDNIAVVGGTLAVNFSGAGSSGHAFGQTWDLVDSPLAIAGKFSGLGVNDEVAVTGLSSPNPLGTAYRVRKIEDGTGETMQLVYDRYLVLRVNRDTGELSVRNPHGGPIQIDGYTVNSPLGSLLTSYSGISGQVSPPNAGWFKPVDGSSQPLNTPNVLTEIKSPTFGGGGGNPTFNVTSIPSFTIGNGFSKTGVGANVNNFGIDGEDLSFSYSTPSGVITGHVEYIGTKFENNMVLRVNPTTGQAFLKNDSLETLKFDGYSITSTTDSLVGATWTGLSAAGGWSKSPATTGALSQTNAASSSTLAPGAQLAIGDIGAFTTTAQQDGLALKFILSEGLVDVGGSLAGDFDADGDVDGRDFLVWQRGGSPAPLSATDLADWRTNYGTEGGGGTNPPETTFRIGSVVFDATAGVAAITAVPEPSTAVMILCVVVAAALLGRQRSVRTSYPYAFEMAGEGRQVGANAMSRRLGWCAMVLTLCAAESAVAVTQGIPLINGDFELPGPAGTKVVAFGETGIPFAPTDPVVTLSSGQLAGGIPGWTFTGAAGGVGECTTGLGCELQGDELPGDSGTEGKGSNLPGNEMILSTNDGKAFQTSTFAMPASLPATQKLLLTFDAVNIFTPTGQAQVTASLYYINAGNRVTIGSPLVVGPVTALQTPTLEFIGGNAALTPALGKQVGVLFDTTSRELDPAAVQSWIGIDDVILEIAGTLPGDFNGDGSITLADYNIIRDNLEESHSFLVDGDIVRDGFVDLNDFRAWKSLPPVISSGVLALIGAVPEPSSLVLLLGAAALMGGLGRKRMPRAMVGLLALVAASSIASSSRAAVLYYESFNTGANPAAGQYSVGPLVPTFGAGQNPTVGPTPFLSGAWEAGAADTLGNVVQTQGLSFLGAPASGGSLGVSLNPDTSVVSSRAFRNLTTPFDATTVGTYYISFLANFGGVGIDPNSSDANLVGHRNIEFEQTAGDEGSNFRVGYATYNGAFSGRSPSQAPLAAGPFGGEVILEGGPASFADDNGATHLIVFKFTLSDQALSDNLEIFLDPNENEEPVIASAAFFNRDITLQRISGPVQFGGGGTSAQFDELRVADTYEDSLPEFPRKGNTNPEVDDLVDILDYQAIISHMNLTGQSTVNGDVTGDGRVDLNDLRLWRDNRTDIPGLGGLGDGAVPEPSSMALALFAALGMFGRGRQRK